MKLVWYFDYISPFAYLQFMAHPDLMQRADLTLRPVLFAGLLNHWGHRGPAEIPAKKTHTFRLCTWQAAKLGIPMKPPPAHPFVPLGPLRLTIALGARYEVVRAVFDFIWREGRSVTDEWPALVRALGVSDADALANSAAAKDELRANGETAVTAGVFGVPTFVADGHLFWGEDATAMLRGYFADPTLFDTPEMRRVSALPAAASRIK